MRNDEFWNDPILKPLIDLLFAHSVPVAPYPEIETCLGLTPKDSHMSINDGYATLSFDYDVQKAKEDCLFNMKEYKEKSAGKGSGPGDLSRFSLDAIPGGREAQEFVD